MKKIIKIPLILMLFAFGLCPGLSLQGQQRLVSKELTLSEFESGRVLSQNATYQNLKSRIAQGYLRGDAFMVQLNTDHMLSNEPLVIDLLGQGYPVIKKRHWIDKDNPEAYSVFGYMKGDKSLPFYYHHAANGRENLTFQTPEDKYYFTGVGEGWYMVYTYDPRYEATEACGEKADAHHQMPDHEEDAPGAHPFSGRAAGHECTLRAVFLMTDRVEVSYNTLKNALEQNISHINSEILKNGNNRNNVIEAYANNRNCDFQIELVALLRSNSNAYGSYNEVTCPVEANGNVMRDQMRDGLDGFGTLSWLRTLRKDYAADLIVMLTSEELRSSTGSCSSGANLNGIAGGIGVDGTASVIVQRAVKTFLDGSHNPDPSNLTLIHELGHNLGCRHEGDHATYQGYCDAINTQKTIMHTLWGTTPCNGGRGERRAVFSHNTHTFTGGAAAGSPNHMNASMVGQNFETQAEFFEDSNWGSNDLAYSGDFNNNSGSLRTIDTPGYVVLSYASNSGNQFVRIKSADYVYITGTFSAERISLHGVPNNASKWDPFPFDEDAQRRLLSEQEQLGAVDQLFAANCYPNPVQSDLTLAWFQSEEARCSIRLIDVSGALLREITRDELRGEGDQQIRMDLSDLPSGMYFLLLNVGTDQAQLQVVKP